MRKFHGIAIHSRRGPEFAGKRIVLNRDFVIVVHTETFRIHCSGYHLHGYAPVLFHKVNRFVAIERSNTDWIDNIWRWHFLCFHSVRWYWWFDSVCLPLFCSCSWYFDTFGTFSIFTLVTAPGLNNCLSNRKKVNEIMKIIFPVPFVFCVWGFYGKCLILFPLSLNRKSAINTNWYWNWCRILFFYPNGFQCIHLN